MTWRQDTMISPPIEDLLDRVDSKFSLVTLAARRARNVNSYFNQLGEGLGSLVPPQVASTARKLGMSVTVVEAAPTPALFGRPAHPYTQALLAQIPRADRRTDGGALEGWMPALDAPPAACPFRARCPRRVSACDAAMPALREVGPGHRVACHLYP